MSPRTGKNGIKRRLFAATAMTVALGASACSFSVGTDTSTDDDDNEPIVGNAAPSDSTVTSLPAETSSTTATTEATTTTEEVTTTVAEVDNAQVVLVRETAERFISSTISEQFGQPLDPTCGDIPSTAPGSTFNCTATTPDGEVVKLLGSIDDSEDLNVITTNVVIGEFMAELAEVGAQVLTEANLGNVTIDCGTESVILDNSQEMICDSVNEDGSAGTVTYTIADTQTGEFEVRIN